MILKLIILFDSIIRTIIPSKNNGSLKKVLIIRTDRIGDFCIWLDSAKEYQKIYPPEEYEITLLGNEVWRQIAVQLPYWKHVFSINYRKFTRNFFYRIYWLAKIKRQGYDVAIYPTYSREFLRGDALLLAAKAKVGIVYEGDESNITSQLKSYTNRYATHVIASPDKQLNEYEINKYFVNSISENSYKSAMTDLSTLVQDRKINDKYYVLSLGAGQKYRQWPVQSFTSLVQRIYEKTKLKGVIVGSQSEALLGDLLIEHSGVPLDNMSGDTTLIDMLTILNYAEFFLGNESGPVHMAACVNTSVFCIAGGGHFGRFIPYKVDKVLPKQELPLIINKKMDCYNCNWNCIHTKDTSQAYPCISDISIDDVWMNIEKKLSLQGF